MPLVESDTVQWFQWFSVVSVGGRTWETPPERAAAIVVSALAFPAAAPVRLCRSWRGDNVEWFHWL